MQEAEGHHPDDARHGRLAELKVELDRCWDLLRQREAARSSNSIPTTLRSATPARSRATSSSRACPGSSNRSPPAATAAQLSDTQSAGAHDATNARGANRWRGLDRGRAAVEREFGRLKNDWALLPRRVRGWIESRSMPT
jgi:hypothetical protein